MNITLFLGFIAATLVIAISPGPSVALASSQAISHGRKAAIVAILGDALGTVVHIIVAVLGLQILVTSAGQILVPLQITGGTYIIYLAIRHLQKTRVSVVQPAENQAIYRSVFLSGFLACISNPKAIVFFMALFPGFIDPTLNIPLQSFIYGISFVVLDGAFIFAYALIALKAARSQLGNQLKLDMLGGYGLLCVGGVLAIKGLWAL